MVRNLVDRTHLADNLGKRAPYYLNVPKELVANLDFRATLLREARESQSVRKDLWSMCRRDILFWFAAFVYTLDPRLDPGFRKTPFIPYEFQEYLILDLVDSIREGSSRAIRKCRDMGMSWCCLGVIYHQWQFEEDFSAGLASRKYEYIVNSNDDRAAFTRLAFIRDNQPKWMIPRHTPLEGRWKNDERGGTIVGEATTSSMFRGARLTVVSLDEFADFETGMDEMADKASANATETRWFNSTPQGSANTFFKKCHPRPNDVFAPVVRRYEWTEHPKHVKGLYSSDKGKLKILDRTFKWPEGYPFVLDGKVRSAWFDKKCAELGWVQSKIAEELLGDFAGSGDPVFDHGELLKVVESGCRPPIRQGMLSIKDRDMGTPGEFIDEPNGPFRLWTTIDAWGCVPAFKRFVIGVDVSKGTGASNDALAVWDRDTKEKVAQYVDCVLGDYKLAELAVATARLFNDAELIWELDGGFTFQKRVTDLGYGKFYCKRSAPTALGEGKVTDTPGFKVTPDTKEQLIKQYVHAMMTRRVFNRDESSVMECGRFRYAKKGGIEHEQSDATDNPSGARANHGDIVTADALAVFLITGYGLTDRHTEQKQADRYNAMTHPDPPRNTAAWRYQQALKSDKEKRFDPLLRTSTAVF